MTGTRETLEDAAALEERAYAAFKAGDVELSRSSSEQSLGIARRLGDAAASVRALAGLMRLALRDRDFREVERLAEECDRLAAESGDRSLGRMPLHMRAEAARMEGRIELALELYDRSIALNHELGNAAMVQVELGNKGWAELANGRLDEAARLFRESLERAAPEDAYGRAFCLLGCARVELERGAPEGIATLEAAERVLAQAGLVWDPAEEDEHARTAALARELGRRIRGE